MDVSISDAEDGREEEERREIERSWRSAVRLSVWCRDEDGDDFERGCILLDVVVVCSSDCRLAGLQYGVIALTSSNVHGSASSS